MMESQGIEAAAPQAAATGLLRRWLATLPMVVVTAASLALLVYAGYGEGLRAYTQLRLERIAALGQVLQHKMETFAQTGLPMRQFTGFAGQAAALADVDRAVVALRVLDSAGRPVFGYPELRPLPEGAAEPSHYELPQAGSSVSQTDRLLRISLPVRDKFGAAASIVIDVDRATVRRFVDEALGPVLMVGIAAGVLFLLVELIAGGHRGRVAELAPTIVFAAAFAIISACLVVALYQVYSAGVRNKTAALAQSIAHRLSAATELGLDLSSFSQLGQAMQVYRRIDPDIRWVALVQDGRIVLDTEPGREGRPYAAGPDVYEFTQPLSGAADLRVAVAVPTGVVLRAIWRSGKNFLALFVACGLVALIFLPASRAMAPRPRAASAAEDGQRARHDLAVVSAAYFLGVFVDAAALSFLPQWSTLAAQQAGLPTSAGSWPFTINFLCLTGALLPAGRFAEHGDLKRLMLAGIAATSGGALLIFGLPGFLALCLGRGLSGVGQALLLVAVQSYGMALAAPGRRTRGVGIQVYAFSAGLICGGAIGGLLAALESETTVFLVGACVGLAAFVYAAVALAGRRARAQPRPGRSLRSDLGAVLADGGFLRALFLGIVGKFVFAGIAMFAVPLILHLRGYAKEDIGQIMMLYALTVLVMTTLAARLSDRLHGAGPVLWSGSFIAGAGILLLGLVSADASGTAHPGFVQSAGAVAAWLQDLPLPAGRTLLVILGVVAMGASQGMLAAPAITYVGETGVAHRRGRPGVVAVYRLLERIGHISGPLAVGALLTAAGGDPIAISGVAVLSVVAGSVFALAGRRRAAFNG